MKTNFIVKLAGGILLVATVVVIGCSKKASNSSLSEEVISGAAKTYSQAHFSTCPNTDAKGTFYPVSTQWRFTGSLAGCGKSSAVSLSVEYSIEVYPICKNNGNQVSPGQSKLYTSSIPAHTYYTDRNGNFSFDETTEAISLNFLGTSICPNNLWTLTVDKTCLTSWRILLDGKEVNKTVGQTTCSQYKCNQ